MLGKAAAAEAAAAHSELIKQKWEIGLLWELPGFSFASDCSRFIVKALKPDLTCFFCCLFFSATTESLRWVTAMHTAAAHEDLPGG